MSFYKNDLAHRELIPETIHDKSQYATMESAQRFLDVRWCQRCKQQKETNRLLFG